MLSQEVVRSLYPGCPFEREVLGLEMVQLILSELLPVDAFGGRNDGNGALGEVRAAPAMGTLLYRTIMFIGIDETVKMVTSAWTSQNRYGNRRGLFVRRTEFPALRVVRSHIKTNAYAWFVACPDVYARRALRGAMLPLVRSARAGSVVGNCLEHRHVAVLDIDVERQEALRAERTL